jgi:hypothetical protein
MHPSASAKVGCATPDLRYATVILLRRSKRWGRGRRPATTLTLEGAEFSTEQLTDVVVGSPGMTTGGVGGCGDSRCA